MLSRLRHAQEIFLAPVVCTNRAAGGSLGALLVSFIGPDRVYISAGRDNRVYAEAVLSEPPYSHLVHLANVPEDLADQLAKLRVDRVIQNEEGGHVIGSWYPFRGDAP
jgi:hypothetical protein